MLGSNTLAYSADLSVTENQSFMGSTPGRTDTKWASRDFWTFFNLGSFRSVAERNWEWRGWKER